MPGVQLHPILYSRVLDVHPSLVLINSFSFLAHFFVGSGPVWGLTVAAAPSGELGVKKD